MSIDFAAHRALVGLLLYGGSISFVYELTVELSLIVSRLD